MSDVDKRIKDATAKLKASGSAVGKSVIDMMPDDDLKVMQAIKNMYQKGELKHCTWAQILQVAKEKANFPGQKHALQNYLRRTS